MRTEREIRDDIEVYERALKIETDPWSRQVFVGRVCALQWVLFEPREREAKERYYNSMIEAARKAQEERGAQIVAEVLSDYRRIRDTRAEDMYWGARGV